MAATIPKVTPGNTKKLSGTFLLPHIREVQSQASPLWTFLFYAVNKANVPAPLFHICNPSSLPVCLEQLNVRCNYIHLQLHC